VRDRADTDFRKVEGTEGAAAPALSPDGSWLAYLADGAVWKRRVAGGNRVKLADFAGDWAACHWDADGQITLSPARLGGLARVPEEGGAARFVTAPRPERGEFATIAGCALPDGSALLLAVRDGNPEPRIEAMHLASGRRQTVVERGSTPRLAATPAGACLLWERAGTVYAAPFDAASLKVTGREVAVADGVLVDRAALHAYYDVADDGTLAYVPGAAFTEDSHLSWLDPDDLEAPPEPLGEERESFAEPRFTADGKYLSVVLKGDPYRAYVFDLARHTLLRVNTSGDCTSAAISPGGLRLAYAVGKDGRYAVLVKHLSDHSEEVLVDAGGACPGELHWSADGKWLAYSLTQAGSMRRDVWVVDVESKKAEPFCASADADERCPRFSPAGTWIAYASDESGRRDVYIRSFPGGKVVRLVSTGGGGGGEPEWSADGRKLYYRGSAGLYLAPITANWADGSRPALVCRTPFGQADGGLSDYAVAPDGRLLVVEPSQRGPTAPQATLVLNWHQLLKPAR
jgi:serine/threonine-protein kinase